MAQTHDFSKAAAMMPELHEAFEYLNAIIPHLEEVRRRYAASGSDEDRREHDEVQREADRRHDAVNSMIKRIEDATGLPPEFFEDMVSPSQMGDRFDRRPRERLTVEQVEATATVDDHLAAALAELVRLIPHGWLEAEGPHHFRLSAEDTGQPVSIVKGVRPESELSAGNRLRQMVQVARDYLANDPRYDHFAGALLIPQLARLGMRIRLLKDIPGSADRIANLWRKPGEVDKTVFELLVGAALAEKGRHPAFIEEDKGRNGRNADIQCLDPFPMVVECKRRETLSEYEIAEERIMRQLYARLNAASRERGLTGVFEIALRVDACSLDLDGVAASCVATAPRASA